MSKKRWTNKFDSLAAREGWTVSTVNEVSFHPYFEEGDIVIEALDDTTAYDSFDPATMPSDHSRFEDDAAAEKHVRRLAATGQAHAIRALELITNTQIQKVKVAK